MYQHKPGERAVDLCELYNRSGHSMTIGEIFPHPDVPLVVSFCPVLFYW